MAIENLIKMLSNFSLSLKKKYKLNIKKIIVVIYEKAITEAFELA